MHLESGRLPQWEKTQPRKQPLWWQRWASWIEALARLGYLAKGVVYMLLGLLAALASTGKSSSLVDTIGVLQLILAQPWGRVMLGSVILGFGGYVSWRLLQGVVDVTGHGNSIKGLAQRAGYICNGFFYGGVAYTGVEILTGSPISDNQETEDWVATVLGWPYGSWLLVGVGVFMIGLGAHECYRAYWATFCKDLRLDEMSPSIRRAVIRISRFGLFARGLLWPIIGLFLIQAALTLNPEQAIGMQEALSLLGSESSGPWLLIAAAVGLMAYGLHQVAEARYRCMIGGGCEKKQS